MKLAWAALSLSLEQRQGLLFYRIGHILHGRDLLANPPLINCDVSAPCMRRNLRKVEQRFLLNP